MPVRRRRPGPSCNVGGEVPPPLELHRYWAPAFAGDQYWPGFAAQRGSVFTVVVVVVDAAGRVTVVVVLRTGFFTTLRVVVRAEE